MSSGEPLALVTVSELRALVQVVEHFADHHFGTPGSACEAKLREAIEPFKESNLCTLILPAPKLAPARWTPEPWSMAEGNFVETEGLVIAEVPCCGGNPYDLPLIAQAPRLARVLGTLLTLWNEGRLSPLAWREAEAVLSDTRKEPPTRA